MTIDTERSGTLIHLTIDSKEVAVPKGTTVYNAAIKHGIEIPIFCYQDRMPPFGACRMCLVEVEKMSKLQTACTLEVSEGMVVKTGSEQAVEGRKGIIEFLLINHPLDCPICDRGGECPLQDNAMNHGPGKSRFYEEKRHFKKPLPLSPVLMLDRERCIICARCTRFGDLIAGDHALEFIDRGYKTEVGTADGGRAESKFIGNTIMICPVGALTSDVYRFRARPWDNDSTESTCPLCPVGCSMILDSRDGEIMRTRSKENREVNDIWLCDKGWFGYEFTHHSDRLNKPYMRRENGALQPIDWEEALTLAAEKFQQAKPSGRLAAFGGNPLTVEENYLFQKLMRDAGGVNHLDHRIGMPLFTLREEGIQSGMEISIGECETLSFWALVGLDLTEEFPVIWLRLKQALNHGAQGIFMGHYAPEIAKHLSKNILHPPGKELEILNEKLPEIANLAKSGKRGALFVGAQYLNSPYRSRILSELQKFCQNHSNLSFNILEGKGNSMGARYAGMRPDMGPLEKQLTHSGFNAIEVLEHAAKDGWGFLYIVGADPAKKTASKLWKEARAKLEFLIVQDIFMTETAQQADLVFPSLSFSEKKGSFMNIEGRIQKLLPGKEIPKNSYSDGEIFIMLAQKMGVDLSLDSHFTDTLNAGVIQLKPSKKIILAQEIATAAMRQSEEKFAATFAPALFDHGVRMKRNSHLIRLAKKPYARIHPNEGKRLMLNDGEIVYLGANGNAISAAIKLDEGVSERTIVLPLGFEELPVHELAAHLLNGLEIEIIKKNTL